jgi:anionic cell wall polymer biosynthesis LytR-Cps2A-Psr (LCP) family protein
LPVVLVAVAVVLVGALGAGFLYASSIDRSVNENCSVSECCLTTPDRRGGQAAAHEAAGEQRGGPAGHERRAHRSDEASGGVSRSDALMVLHLAADRRSAYLISFPRDPVGPDPARGRNKINAAYAFGGASLTVRTLEGMLDVRMDHVAEVNWTGFIASH